MGQDPDAMSVAVAIVNYGTAEMVIEALPALRRELAPLPRRVVFIVDNASPGDDAARLAEHLATSGPGGGPDPEIRLIASERNGGFAAGNNLAFAAIRGLDWTPDAVLMLNPDAEPRPGALREMLTVMAGRPKAGFVGPRLENPDGSTWTAAFRFPTAMSEFAGATGIGALIRRWPVVLPESETPMRADWVTGAAMLARWEAIEAAGDMDEGYFLYYEEIDFMRRAAEAGWQNWHAPSARVLHSAGGATGILDGAPREGRMPDYWFGSWRRYFAKNHGAGYARTAAALKLLGMAIGAAQRGLRGRSYGRAPGFWGDFLRKALLASLSPLPRSEAP
ncbi:MAG: glycosyltransferase family 2 protein [Pseudomonadota bacterium]